MRPSHDIARVKVLNQQQLRACLLTPSFTQFVQESHCDDLEALASFAGAIALDKPANTLMMIWHSSNVKLNSTVPSDILVANESAQVEGQAGPS
jgi:hypothetical protein